MRRREEFVAQLKESEGLRLEPYKDSVGVWTIGYGHNIQARPLNWYMFPAAIPLRVAEAILQDDVDETIRQLDERLYWWRELDEVREQVVADMAWNMGIGIRGERGLLSFVNTLDAIRLNRWQDAHDGMLRSKWASQVGGRAVRLAEMMLTGQA